MTRVQIRDLSLTAAIIGLLAMIVMMAQNYNDGSTISWISYLNAYGGVIIFLAVVVGFDWLASGATRVLSGEIAANRTLAAAAIVVAAGAAWIYLIDPNFTTTWRYYAQLCVSLLCFMSAVAVFGVLLEKLELALCGETMTVRSWAIMMLVAGGVMVALNAILEPTKPREVAAWVPIVSGLLILAAGLWWAQHVKRSRPLVLSVNSGGVAEAGRDGLPSLSWTQEIGTGESVGQEGIRFEWWVMKIVLFGGLGIGFLKGGWQGALIGGAIGAFLAGLVPREAAAPDIRMPIFGSGGAAPRPPRQPSERDRRAEAVPITRREDCEAFLEAATDKMWFCIASGDKRKGPLRLVERIPYDSFGNFEEGSHSSWFRAKGAVNEMLDWGVIVAQSNEGRVVRVAESVADHAMLVELLVKLQTTFVAPRPKILREFQAARENSEPKPQNVKSEPSAPMTPF
jgi:hypothetical protein